MRLIVTTRFAVVAEAQDVVHLRAEDAAGVFSIMPGHADFLTALVPSVVAWRDGRGAEKYVAVRGGVLEVSGGDWVAIATPEAIPGNDRHRLETEVVPELRRRHDTDQALHADAQRLYIAALREMVQFLRGRTGPTAPNRPYDPDDLTGI